jgi:P27 family predicted phage terminase small subunit
MPSSLKVLYGGKPMPAEPVPGELEVAPPPCLSGRALEEWHRIGPDLEAKGLLTAWDIGPFTIYCESVQAFEDAQRAVSEHGMLVPGRNGLLVKNPAVQLARDAAMLLLASAARFGLTPSDRSSLTLRRPDSESGSLFSK